MILPETASGKLELLSCLLRMDQEIEKHDQLLLKVLIKLHSCRPSTRLEEFNQAEINEAEDIIALITEHYGDDNDLDA